MITFVTFKWKTPGYRTTFTAQHVNTLRRMIARNYTDPHELVCVSDDHDGLDPEIRRMKLWTDYADIPSPHGLRFPSCYRRLKIFSADAHRWLGERIALIDIDTVITGDIRPVINRREDFVAWGGTNRGGGYNCSLVLLRAGTRTEIWDDVNPKTSPRLAFNAGFVGSDQGWISYRLGRGVERTFSKEDGVYSYRLDIKKQGTLPQNTKIVFWNGQVDPWDEEAQRLEWVRKNYR